MKKSSYSNALKSLLNKFGPVLALIVVYFFFAILNSRIMSFVAVMTIIQQTVIVGIAAIGMTLIIITGGIDLSVGSIIALCSVSTALAMNMPGISPAAAAMIGVAVGISIGIVNGLLITKIKLVPFIATLGSLLIIRGIAKGFSNNMPVNVPQTWISELLAAVSPEEQWKLFPAGGWLMIVLAVIFTGILRYTPFGRHVFAIGSNESTARLCGVAVERVKLLVYAIGGGLTGLSGLMLLSYQDQGDPTGAVGMELNVIAAVVIGGGSLNGGEGSIFGSLIGALIMTVIRTGCQLNGWAPWITEVVTGVIIIAAVAVDRIRHNRARM